MRYILCLVIALMASPALAQTTFTAEGKISVISTIVANNTTAIQIKATGGTVYQVDGYSKGTTIAYAKLYNGTTTTVTCGSGTPRARYVIPYGTDSSGNASGAGFITPNINGDAYPSGITLCITGGIADNDTTSPAASKFIVNVHFK